MEPMNLDDLARRPQRYWDVDGLPEVTMGLLWMAWGGAWLFGESLPHDQWAYKLYWSLTPALLAGGGFLAVWATKRLKARFTFPRAGYVAWKEPSRLANLGAAAVAILVSVVVVVAIARADAPAGHNAAPVLGVILSLGFVVASLRQRAPHYLALAGVAIALGLALGTTAGGWESANWLFVWLGVASAFVGAVRFVLFMRRHPRSTLETP